jgi:hypothetical protein
MVFSSGARETFRGQIGVLMRADRVGGVKTARGVVDRVWLSILFELDEVLFVDVAHATNGVPGYRGIRHGNGSFGLLGF